MINTGKTIENFCFFTVFSLKLSVRIKPGLVVIIYTERWGELREERRREREVVIAQTFSKHSF